MPSLSPLQTWRDQERRCQESNLNMIHCIGRILFKSIKDLYLIEFAKCNFSFNKVASSKLKSFAIKDESS